MISPRFFSFQEGCIECSLCPRRCLLAPGEGGSCGARFNLTGKAAIPFYGLLSALATDPIEKKPLYHFRPGTQILSAGFIGCNLHCPFCQNWHISQNVDQGGGARGRFYSPAQLIAAVDMRDSAHSVAVTQSVAYTYSEPLVHVEFLLDCMKEARKKGVANVLVSNGCVNSEAAGEILELTDAANIDLKCFSEESYEKILGGDLDAVTGFIRMAAEKGVHLEITTLVVPGLNDSRQELDKCRDFIRELQSRERAVPWHLSAYRPEWKWRSPATEPDFLVSAARRAKKKLAYVYTGNIAAVPERFNDTCCLHCGKTLIGRCGYRVDTSGILLKEENGKLSYFCSQCGGLALVKH